MKLRNEETNREVERLFNIFAEWTNLFNNCVKEYNKERSEFFKYAYGEDNDDFIKYQDFFDYVVSDANY